MTKLLCGILAILVLATAKPAHAEESLNITGKRARVVAKSAMYGAVGGLVVGLASQVFQRKTKNIFLFGSLGLYAGIILGVYVITTSGGPAPYEGPDTYEDYSSQLAPGAAPEAIGPKLSAASYNLARNDAGLRLRLLSLEF